MLCCKYSVVYIEYDLQIKIKRVRDLDLCYCNLYLFLDLSGKEADIKQKINLAEFLLSFTEFNRVSLEFYVDLVFYIIFEF